MLSKLLECGLFRDLVDLVGRGVHGVLDGTWGSLFRQVLFATSVAVEEEKVLLATIKCVGAEYRA